jgi:hypothetical protein
MSTAQSVGAQPEIVPSSDPLLVKVTWENAINGIPSMSNRIAGLVKNFMLYGFGSKISKSGEFTLINHNPKSVWTKPALKIFHSFNCYRFINSSAKSFSTISLDTSGAGESFTQGPVGLAIPNSI